jgi:hypothetical protein
VGPGNRAGHEAIRLVFWDLKSNLRKHHPGKPSVLAAIPGSKPKWLFRGPAESQNNPGKSQEVRGPFRPRFLTGKKPSRNAAPSFLNAGGDEALPKI